MTFVAIAGLVVAALGLPTVWIALRASHKAKQATDFGADWEYVDRNQPQLRAVAWSSAPAAWRSDVVPMLAKSQWIMDRPIPLDSITVRWQSEPLVKSRDPARTVRPKDSLGRLSYSTALVSAAGKTGLFNGIIYRPLHVDALSANLQLTFAKGRYFDYLDSSEVLAFELGARLRTSKPGAAAGPRRQSVTDPFDLTSRTTSLGINTLTIRASEGQHTFFMHKRSGARVVNESDLVHVVPAGEFAPSDISLEAITVDFNIWRNIMREYAEEFLNKEEAYGRGGQPVDYDGDSPYAELSAARTTGNLRVSAFGLALDPLCLKPELLTVCVFDPTVFDTVFADMVSEDDEGILLVGQNRQGIPFTAANVELYANSPETATAGAACLKLAWMHREALGLFL